MLRPSVPAVMLAMALAVVPSASAQSLSLEVKDGFVTLDARGATVRDILERWTQVGGVTVINPEVAPATPVTLQLVGVPERAALASLLRGASGYMLLARRGTGRAESAIDRIVLVRSTTPAPEGRSAAPAATAGSLDQTWSSQAPGPAPSAGDPRSGGSASFDGATLVTFSGNARTIPGIGAPSGTATPNPGARPSERAVRPNPFGVSSGSAQPGVIVPVHEPAPENGLSSGGEKNGEPVQP
jgi:hypothetical protein